MQPIRSSGQKPLTCGQHARYAVRGEVIHLVHHADRPVAAVALDQPRHEDGALVGLVDRDAEHPQSVLITSEPFGEEAVGTRDVSECHAVLEGIQAHDETRDVGLHTAEIDLDRFVDAVALAGLVVASVAQRALEQNWCVESADANTRTVVVVDQHAEIQIDPLALAGPSGETLLAAAGFVPADADGEFSHRNAAGVDEGLCSRTFGERESHSWLLSVIASHDRFVTLFNKISYYLFNSNIIL